MGMMAGTGMAVGGMVNNAVGGALNNTLNQVSDLLKKIEGQTGDNNEKEDFFPYNLILITSYNTNKK